MFLFLTTASNFDWTNSNPFEGWSCACGLTLSFSLFDTLTRSGFTPSLSLSLRDTALHYKMHLPVTRDTNKRDYEFDMLVDYFEVLRILSDILYPKHAKTLTEFERSSQFSTPTISSYIIPN